MRQCAICGKGSVIRGKRKLLRGHYNPVNTSRKYPNLQYAKVGGARKLICTNCLRSLHKGKLTPAGKKPTKRGRTKKATAKAAA